MRKRFALLFPLAFVAAGCCTYGPQLESIADVQRTEKGLEIRLKGDVTFEYRSAELKDQASQIVDTLGQGFVKDKVKSILVVGHTDNRGTERFNMRLSQDRAQSVKDRLIAQGVDAGIITTDGKGFTVPIAPNDTEEGRTKNRRVEILVQE
jgi:outer membrane protein OmpA-like peptidoglycan-associated protein